MHNQPLPDSTAASPQAPVEDVTAIVALARFSGTAQEFWRTYIRRVARLAGARQAMLAGPVATSQEEGEAQGWQVLQTWIAPESQWPLTPALAGLAVQAVESGIRSARIDNQIVLAVPVDVGPQEQPPVLLLDLPVDSRLPDSSMMRFAAAIPNMFQVMRQFGKARHDAIYFAEILKLLGKIQQDDKFRLAGMHLCNELAALFQCDLVSLGWVRAARSQVKVVVLSNLSQFDKRANTIRELENVMEECLDQDAEILFNSSNKDGNFYPAHDTYAGLRGIGNLMSLPMRIDDKVVAVITCERRKAPFTETDAWRLRLLLEQCGYRLHHLEENDRAFPVRWARRSGRFLKNLLKLEKTGKKLATLAVLSAIIVMALPIYPYQVTAPFLLKADRIVHISAPDDGLIDTVPVRPGDLVEAGDIVASLNTRDLLLDRANGLARQARFLAEVEKNRAIGALADMRVAAANFQEIRIELEQIDNRLENSVMKAPFDAVVVEGEMQERIGAPVRKGESFMRLAALDDLYAEIMVLEKDLRQVAGRSVADLVFVGRPDTSSRLHVRQWIPEARVHDGENAIAAHARMDGTEPDWWRPGMSGIAHFPVGDRSLWWILSHDAIDWLYLNYWTGWWDAAMAGPEPDGPDGQR